MDVSVLPRPQFYTIHDFLASRFCSASFAQLCAMVFRNCTGCACNAIVLGRVVFRFGSIFAHCEKSHACTVDAQ